MLTRHFCREGRNRAPEARVADVFWAEIELDETGNPVLFEHLLEPLIDFVKGS